MDRRQFLTGTFGGLVAGGMLLKTPVAEAAALELDAPLVVIPPVLTPPGNHVGETLFTQDGRLFGVVREIRLSVEPIDMTGVGDTYRRFEPGPRFAEATVVMFARHLSGYGFTHMDVRFRP